MTENNETQTGKNADSNPPTNTTETSGTLEHDNHNVEEHPVEELNDIVTNWGFIDYDDTRPFTTRLKIVEHINENGLLLDPNTLEELLLNLTHIKQLQQQHYGITTPNNQLQQLLELQQHYTLHETDTTPLETGETGETPPQTRTKKLFFAEETPQAQQTEETPPEQNIEQDNSENETVKIKFSYKKATIVLTIFFTIWALSTLINMVN